MAGRRGVRPLLNHLITLLTDGVQPLARVLLVQALVEILQLQLALLLGAGLPNVVGALDPILLKSVAARRLLPGLKAALIQQPFISVDAEPSLQVHKRHDACLIGAPPFWSIQTPNGSCI